LSSGTENTTSRGTVLGDAHDGRAGRDHLSRLDLDRSHHARDVGDEVGIAGLVALRRQLRLGLFQLGLRGFQRGFAALDFGAADEVLLAQRLVALVVGSGQVTVGPGGGGLRAGRVRGQPVVLRVELGQQLPARTRWPTSAWRRVTLPATRKPRRDSTRGFTSPENSRVACNAEAPTVSTFTARTGSAGGSVREQAASRSVERAIRLQDCERRESFFMMAAANFAKRSSYGK
jgi:hypothetical protein